MAWSGGSFTRTNGTHSGATTWAQDEAASVGIESGRHDLHDEDLADGINACLNKDGSNSPTAAMNFDSQRLTNLGNATARTNAVNLGQIQDQGGVWGGTSAGTANAQTITCSVSPGAYATGQRYMFKAGNANTASATLNVNSLGAITIYKDVNGLRAALGSGDLIANGIYEVVYDSAGGGQFVLQTSKPGVASFTGSLAPNSGSYTASRAILNCAKNGQVMHIVGETEGTLNSGSPNYFRINLPTAISSAYTENIIPCMIKVGATYECGFAVLTTSVCDFYRAGAAAYTAGTVQFFPNFAYFTA